MHWTPSSTRTGCWEVTSIIEHTEGSLCTPISRGATAAMYKAGKRARGAAGISQKELAVLLDQPGAPNGQSKPKDVTRWLREMHPGTVVPIRTIQRDLDAPCQGLDDLAVRVHTHTHTHTH